MNRKFPAVILSFLLALLLASPVHALSWAYDFVVWDGKVYEVTEEELAPEEVAGQIGSVRTQANENTGSYYGNASNAYPRGTPYFSIDGVSEREAIVVQDDESRLLVAEFRDSAPFHWMNVVIGAIPFLLILAGVGAVVLIGIYVNKTRQHEKT
ncbi:hypothetical protein CR205_09300 [Alteribacter lacisalsi]|uniref:DUF3592 domain-containing protein n=1 Tax=Alteribacter lacisalsi TaxID=2045244 RepID=A0A2W0HFN5_9BACI|nr:hypothetical protein [Alteribacter lacisalsi]PYZ98750.1 hypothetical protein CR205_09300 [Alteribacter lacisalsi]